MSQKRRNFKSGFKAKVVLEALKERETIESLAKKYELSPNQISTWKSQALLSFENVFSKEKTSDTKSEVDIEKLYSQIGQMKVEIDFLKKKLY